MFIIPDRKLRIASAPSGQGDVILGPEIGTILEPSRKRRQSQFDLTQETAEELLQTCFNLDPFIEELKTIQEKVTDVPTLINYLKKCVVESKIVSFSGVSKQHLSDLGLDSIKSLHLDAQLVAAANKSDSPANSSLHQSTLQAFERHFNVSKESGCRCIINQYLTASLVYAQDIIKQNGKLRKTLEEEYRVEDPHLAVFTDLRIPHARVEYDEVYYVFHGFLDYAVGFIREIDIDSLRYGSLTIAPETVLTGILEVKSVHEMKDAEPQIVIQLVTILALRQKKFFSGALTNGALWRFFVARMDDKLTIYSSKEFSAERVRGVIIELLKDLMMYHGSPMFVTKLD